MKANQREIVAALPEEFHAEFLKELETPPIAYPRMSEAEEVEAIKAD